MNQFPYVFFLGIGGIGMSALARWFRANGHQVSGYDKTETPLTRALTAEGIAIHYADAVANIPAEIRENRAQTFFNGCRLSRQVQDERTSTSARHLS